jgi:TolB-like protein/DNA-binding winged helix-turn-helix (wHTH) protein/Flp pilus assembly protein TadD
MTETGQPRMVRFGLFEVDLRARELRKNGVKIRLQEQPFQVLAILLQHAGDIVTREELRRELWPADTFVDFEHSLNAAVKRLRDALGDSAENPLFVETLARRGYRFNAQVDGRIAPPSAQSPTAPSRVLRRSYVLGLSCLAVGILVAALIWAKNSRGRAASGDDTIASLAVLPLENLSRDPEQEYFSDGMTEELISALSRIDSLRVISRTTVMQYKGGRKSLPQIGRELNVDGVIEGSVLRSGNRVRITAELIDARTDRHLWGQTYERDLGDILVLQGEVAQTIAERIHARLTPQQQSRVRANSIVNPEAYEAYLRGRFYEMSTGTRTALKQAQGYYENAVRKDPTFALAYVGLADCYLDLGAYRLVPPQEAYRRGSEAIHKALQLDETLGEAHSSLGYLDWRFEWNWQQAEKDLRYAIELNPNSMESHETLVWYLAWSGRRAEALAEVEKMRRLDPAYPFTPVQESGVYYHLRDYKSLVEAGEKSVAAYPNGWSSHYFLAIGYEGSGRPAQSIPEYQRAVELSEADSDTMAGLAHAYIVTGRRPEAEKILRELQTRSKTDYISPYMIGVIYAGLGKKDKAFEFLEKAYKEKSPDVAYFLKADLRIDSLRLDPRFIDLLRRMNFPSNPAPSNNER